MSAFPKVSRQMDEGNDALSETGPLVAFQTQENNPRCPRAIQNQGGRNASWNRSDLTTIRGAPKRDATVNNAAAASGSVDYGGLFARDERRAFERLHKRHSVCVDSSNFNDEIPSVCIQTLKESIIFVCKLRFLPREISPFEKSGGFRRSKMREHFFRNVIRRS